MAGQLSLLITFGTGFEMPSFDFGRNYVQDLGVPLKLRSSEKCRNSYPVSSVVLHKAEDRSLTSMLIGEYTMKDLGCPWQFLDRSNNRHIIKT